MFKTRREVLDFKDLEPSVVIDNMLSFNIFEFPYEKKTGRYSALQKTKKGDPLSLYGYFKRDTNRIIYFLWKSLRYWTKIGPYNDLSMITYPYLDPRKLEYLELETPWTTVVKALISSSPNMKNLNKLQIQVRVENDEGPGWSEKELQEIFSRKDCYPSLKKFVFRCTGGNFNAPSWRSAHHVWKNLTELEIFIRDDWSSCGSSLCDDICSHLSKVKKLSLSGIDVGGFFQSSEFSIPSLEFLLLRDTSGLEFDDLPKLQTFFAVDLYGAQLTSVLQKTKILEKLVVKEQRSGHIPNFFYPNHDENLKKLFLLELKLFEGKNLVLPKNIEYVKIFMCPNLCDDMFSKKCDYTKLRTIFLQQLPKFTNRKWRSGKYITSLHLRSLKKVKDLFFQRNSFSNLQVLDSTLGTDLCGIDWKRLPNLTFLSICTQYKFEDKFFQTMDLPKLQVLKLQETDFTGENWRKLPKLRSLELHLIQGLGTSGRAFQDDFFREHDHENLEVLALVLLGKEFTGKGWNQNFKSLKKLKLQSCTGVKDDLIFQENEFPALRELSVSMVHIKGEKWVKMPQLEKLKLQGISGGMTDQFMMQEKGRFDRLKYLLIDTNEIKGIDWAYLPSLEKLVTIWRKHAGNNNEYHVFERGFYEKRPFPPTCGLYIKELSIGKKEKPAPLILLDTHLKEKWKEMSAKTSKN